MQPSEDILAIETQAALLEGVSTPPGQRGVRSRILVYLGALILLTGFGSPLGGLIDLPISFFLKNKLHLQAHEVAQFRLIAGAPIYISVLFGFARDTINPFGMGDRGFIVLFGAICAVVYTVFAFLPVTYVTLLIGMILLTVVFLFVASAQSGLTASIAQQNVMSGQISVVMNVALIVPGLAASLLGGVLSDQLEGNTADEAARILFLVGAVIMAAVSAYGLQKPRAVFGTLRVERTRQTPRWEDFKRLVKHWPIYPALLIIMMWNFQPGAQTPLQYYLQNTLHSNDAQWGQWQAIAGAAFIPAFIVFGVLCQRFPLRPMLFWGALIATPQFLPLLLVHSVTGALVAAGIMGLMGGFCTAAYTDLLIRSCPRGLQGATFMLSATLVGIAARFGDVLGTGLYNHYGNFTVCVIAITLVYALIVPLLFLVPRGLIDTPDGEAIALSRRSAMIQSHIEIARTPAHGS